VKVFVPVVGVVLFIAVIVIVSAFAGDDEGCAAGFSPMAFFVDWEIVIVALSRGGS
jgi:hypothetical protein